MVGADRFDVVLFDLGGVLVRLGGVAKLQALADMATEDHVWSRWLTCRWVRSFERGRCSADEFAAGVVADWRLPLTPDAFLEEFRSWPEGLFEGAAELVESVRASIAVGCLSNTNELHWSEQAVNWGLGRLFDVTFLSHQLGLIKPDRELFDHVTAVLGVEPRRVLFLDDNDINVSEAVAAGLTAFTVRGVPEAKKALEGVGVLSTSRHGPTTDHPSGSARQVPGAGDARDR